MSQPFKPLAAPVAHGTAAPAAGFRLKVASPPPAQPSFTPVVVGHEHAPAPSANAEPVVTLQRDGDRVTGIQIQCGCGQTIELNCVY